MRRIAVIGLGYIGLVVAPGFPDTLGFDRDATRLDALRLAGRLHGLELVPAGVTLWRL